MVNGARTIYVCTDKGVKTKQTETGSGHSLGKAKERSHPTASILLLKELLKEKGIYIRNGRTQSLTHHVFL